MTKRVYVHIGCPKTGTTMLQQLLLNNREQLRAQGVLYPAHRFDGHFLPALDLLDRPWGGLEVEAVGAWDRLVEESNAWPGQVIVSHEILAAATPEQAARALAGLQGELHLVLSVRDLARQVPAEWQESIKHRRQFSYGDFCHDLMRDEPTIAQVRWFWQVQHGPQILDRWAASLPPARVHVLTVPPSTAPRQLLLQRFTTVLGLDPQWLPVREDRSNPSLGGVEATVIRALNARLPPAKLAPAYYREIVRELLTHHALAAAPDADRVLLHPDLSDWAVEVAERWIGRLRQAAYDVVGDLDDLRPQPPSARWTDPDASDDRQQLVVTNRALDAVVLELARVRAEQDRERAAVGASSAPAVRVPSADEPVGPWPAGVTRVKQALLAREDHNRAVRVALRALRRARGQVRARRERSSRSA